MKNLAILISDTGTGSNLQAIIDAIENRKLKAKIVVVISSSKDAYGLVRAKINNYPTIIIDKNNNLENILNNVYKVDFIALAGWKMIIPQSLINTFPNRILNIHPGLVPDTVNGIVYNPDKTKGLWNKGKLTEVAIQNFLDHRATYAGSTVHFLSNKFDFGPVLNRCFEKILPEDSVNSLYARLKKKEHKIYVKSLIKLCS